MGRADLGKGERIMQGPPMWYILDQIIMSKDVLPLFVKESLKIITSCGGIDLANGKGHPNKKISDHFPIMCEIRDE